jgi:hypothetical protein
MTQPRLFPVQQEQLTSDDYYTPAWVFQRMNIEFDLDVCAPPGGIPWIPAKRYYTQADDGLTSPWEGRVWMNPPYSNTTPWARRFIAHANGICLVQHAKSRWHIELMSTAEAIVAPADGYFDFTGGSISMPVMFAAFGDDCIDAIRRLGVVRKIA